MIRIRTIQFQLCLKGYTISQPTLKTLIYGVTRRINIIIQEFKDKIIPCVRYREILCEDLIKSFLLPFLRWSIKLQEILERLKLHFQEIRIL